MAGQVTVLKFCTLISPLYFALDSSSFLVINSCVGTFSFFFHLGEILAELDCGLPGLMALFGTLLSQFHLSVTFSKLKVPLIEICATHLEH